MVIEYEINPNETFTSKAKRALEMYKTTKGSDSASVSSQSNGAVLRVKSSSRHAPMPFRSDDSNSVDM